MRKDIYLIPANTKKGQLIFSIFTPFDMALFGTGLGISLIFLIDIGASSITRSILVLFPALFTALLVMPVPNYHNVITFVKSMFNFFTNQRKFLWKGWGFYEFTKEQTK